MVRERGPATDTRRRVLLSELGELAADQVPGADGSADLHRLQGPGERHACPGADRLPPARDRGLRLPAVEAFEAVLPKAR